MKVPPFLKKGDKIAIVAPASTIPNELEDAIALLESWDLIVVVGASVSASFHQFAGDDDVRTQDFQKMLDDGSIKAIVAARGGYGTVRIIDRLNFTAFEKNPKWIIGFSDITVLHSHLQAIYGIPTIHGQMPMTIPDATKSSLKTLKSVLFGKELSYAYKSEMGNRSGQGEGILVGGNLAILVSVSGSISEVDYAGKILFLEEVGEYYYAVDRMLRMLKRAGKLAKLKGIIVGGFTGMKDKAVPFGFSVEEIILDLVKEYGYPVAASFPAGHIDNNSALILGKKVSLTVEEQNISLTYL